MWAWCNNIERKNICKRDGIDGEKESHFGSQRQWKALEELCKYIWP
jgi:hypothetical protein